MELISKEVFKKTFYMIGYQKEVFSVIHTETAFSESWTVSDELVGEIDADSSLGKQLINFAICIKNN